MPEIIPIDNQSQSVIIWELRGHNMTGLVEGGLALVTGASSGIGRQACLVLAREGASVVITCINEAGAQETLASLTGNGHTVMKLDVTDFKAAQEVVKTVELKYGRPPNILVNCAGIFHPTSVWDATPDSFQKIIDVNLKGTFFTSQAVCKALVSAGLPGSVVNVSSIASDVGPSTFSAYAASKSGVKTVTQCLAKDMGQYNIRVNAVQPGMIDTAMVANCPPEMSQAWIDRLATKRMGDPQEVAEVIVFLASDRSSYINGIQIPVNGGV